jgi:endosialidase-like protein
LQYEPAPAVHITTATDVICIGTGFPGTNVSDSGFINNIRDVTTQNGDAIPVVIDSAGQLETASSSRRFREDIKPMDGTSETILALKPVTFHYKSDTTDTPQFGLIAEEVAKVNPALVVHDRNGEIYSVRYDAVNAMLLNEFLKEHRKVEQLTKDFESKLAEQQKQIEALTAGVQKVTAQLEASKPVPQVVNNP